MKRARVAAFGLLVVLCLLLAAPAAQAGGLSGAPDGWAIKSPAVWFGDLFERLARWLTWAEKASSRPSSKSVASSTCDSGAVADPTGAPCGT